MTRRRRGSAPRRCVAFALSGAVAAVATHRARRPTPNCCSPRRRCSSRCAIRADEALLPAPATYVREERFQRGDTLPGLLARLGIGEADAQQAAAPARRCGCCAPGTIVTAEVRAGAAHEGELVWLSFLASRDAVVRDRARRRRAWSRASSRAQIVTRTELKSAVIRSSLFARDRRRRHPGQRRHPARRRVRQRHRFPPRTAPGRPLLGGLRDALGRRPAAARRARARRRVRQPGPQATARSALRRRLLRPRRQEHAQGAAALAARVLARQLRLRHAHASVPADLARAPGRRLRGAGRHARARGRRRHRRIRRPAGRLRQRGDRAPRQPQFAPPTRT